jgi:O-methyltransferase
MTYNQLSSCPDIEPEFVPIYEAARPFTMTSLERVYALFQAVRHVVRQGIAGDIVECGVWKGGSMIAAIETLKHLGRPDRQLWLYDTFEGMPPPGEEDVQYDGITAEARLAAAPASSMRFGATLEEVRSAISATGYPDRLIRCVQGMVEQTLPQQAPSSVAVLRLDTDWYASTRAELEVLYPRLVSGGVLIVDDYGHWRGCRKAVDEYFAEHRISMLLTRVDYTCRVGIKP